MIVGKNGQVGQELADRAETLALDFIAFGSNELDVRNRTAVLAAVKKYQPTVLINAAAYTAVDKAEEEEELAYAVNRDGVENLALACKAQNSLLIHISTDYVFDGSKETAYLESDQPNPRSVYGASKYAGEEILQSIWHKHIIVRVSWVFGVRGSNFVKTMLRLANDRDQLSVVNDQFGAPTSARFIAAEILRVAGLEGIYGLFHMPSGPYVNWYEFANVIFEEAVDLGLLAIRPKVLPIASDQYPTAAERPKNSELSSESGQGGFETCRWRDELILMLKQMRTLQEHS
ncbi:dTDP-4-dehydrorhamnose reductase [Oceanicoccus sagamiensis]|uniref:dTDP-4-dehydrorhamnose reductase n=1 Tax=Oceanicoccus sagamiensis TaxID=716816 RepID=A0A1X9NE72_9GAMM|nr:dTDP-4-dehydrorhamnose reductase [Oceanicoccus sagamiensis]ARN76330.1 dTDP-4-dehydrorhamnose reductase [Oceanicoccus sagamiensis]